MHICIIPIISLDETWRPSEQSYSEIRIATTIFPVWFIRDCPKAYYTSHAHL